MWIDPDRPAVVLAPMEGVTDAPMRALQGEIGAFDYAVSEFLRISQFVPSRSVIQRHVPETRNGARTSTGLATQVQLLGGDPRRLALAAEMAIVAGARAIDLNFGCPAKTVNRHDGGATLLKYPGRIRDICRATRQAVPPELPVSAKLRLGWDTTDAIDENAAMAVEGGVSWLTIHARTREQGYAPPVDWKAIGRVRSQAPVPVIANGDIWTLDDFRRCRDETGCIHFMLGRGALADPLLSHRVAAELGIKRMKPEPAEIGWPVVLEKLQAWTSRFQLTRSNEPINRAKQWLSLASKYGAFRQFDRVKRTRTMAELLRELRAFGTNHEPRTK